MNAHTKRHAQIHSMPVPHDILIGHDAPQLLTSGTKIDPQTRHRMIAEAAYLIAAKRGFQGDSAMDDWLKAEARIDAQLQE